MENTFTYEKNGISHTLLFNPEAFGFIYYACKCSYVRFDKNGENISTRMQVYPNQKITIETFVYEMKGGQMGSKLDRDKTKTIKDGGEIAYPISQENLEYLLRINNVL